MLMKSILEKAGVDIRKETDTELICICPFHKDIHPSLTVNKFNGIFNCFGCSASGNWMELVGRLKVGASFTPTVSPIKKTKPITDLSNFWRGAKVERFRNKRGLSLEVIRKFEVLEDDEFLIFPVRDKHNKLLGVIKRVEKVFYTYLSSGGVLYGAQFIKQGERVILTEGITDVLKAFDYGYSVVGLLTNNITDKQKNILTSLTDEVIMALDNDTQGKLGSWEVYEKIKECVNILVVSFPKDRKDLGELTKKEMAFLVASQKTFTKVACEAHLK